MAFFYSFTDSLRQKWLQFFLVNRDWITLHMEIASVSTPDGGKRPPSYLILGVVNALEPKLAQLMLPFAKLNPDAETLIQVLDLHFDPDIALSNRVQPVEAGENMDESEVIMGQTPYDETLTILQTNGFGEKAIVHEFVMVDSQEETLVSPNEEFGDVSLSHGQNSIPQTSSVKAVDEFGDISFGELKDSHSKISAATTPEANPQQMREQLNTPDENAFNDVLSDVWAEETAASTRQVDKKMFSGEDLPSDVFDDSEIARLFPNT